MNSAIERLLTLRIGDIMNSPVETLHENDTMSAAAARLAELDVSGAPVVDDCGRCVGMLSVTDFALREARNGSSDAPDQYGWQMGLVMGTDGRPLHLEEFSTDRVGEHMSPAVQTVSPSASLVNAGRILCREHIHRLVIVDDEGRPIGMVSSLDLVAAMVAAIEE
ncbi:MAG: CBS domain-containing protein [Planctomycetales bacterium]|nr:CBS domain-containing protein [Planctomycetales bacterium]